MFVRLNYAFLRLMQQNQISNIFTASVANPVRTMIVNHLKPETVAVRSM